MKVLRSVLMLAALVAASVSPLTAAESIQEIERMPFDDAYRLWLQEQQTVVLKLPVFPSGSPDPKTGTFTPTTFWALTCRLGREAHMRESFFMSALVTNEWICEILETSPQLCEIYGVKSQASILFDPERGYTCPTRSYIMGPETRRKTWLEAVKKASSQQSGAANRSQPIRSETNRTPSAAGSRR